jgi:hypothetical protein
MNGRKTLSQLSLIGLVAVLFLSSCNLPMAASSADLAGTATAAATPLIPTATFTLVPVVTDTPLPTATEAATATATLQSVAQVVPTVNAYCRKGPSTQYHMVTTLQQGNPYTVVGQNGLKSWWQVQADTSTVCWVGDANVTRQGPVDQAPLVIAPSLPGVSKSFTNTYVCNTVTKTLAVTLNWTAATGATGFNLYRNGTLLKAFKADVYSYLDDAPVAIKLTYELEAFNDYGVGDRLSTSVPACK